MVSRIFTATLLAMLAAMALASATWAGSYHVYTCRTPAGEAAPADGWIGSTAAGGAYDDYAIDTCSMGGALVAALGDKTTHLGNVDRATWTFEAPSADRLVRAILWRAGYSHGRGGENTTYQFWFAGPSKTNVFDECIFTTGCHVLGEPGQPLVSANKLAVPTPNVGQNIFMNVSCSAGISGSECGNGFSDPSGYAAVVYLYAADLTLEQATGPQASAVSGELATAATVSGTSDVMFTATDPGAGVYEAIVRVDGTVVQTTVLDENGGRCKNVGQTSDGLPAFLYVQPCLASVSTDVAVDTTGMANGSHHLTVSAVDAAGNTAPVLDRNIVVANTATPASQPSPAGSAGGGAGRATAGANAGAGGGPTPGSANGTPASTQAALAVAWKGTRSARLVAGFGRAETITGSLTGPGGAPIGGALIDLVSRPAYSGAPAVTLASPHTAADGSFTVRIPAGACSQTLSFAYRAHVGDPLAVATRTLTLAVQAGVGLAIAPRTAGVGRRIYFSGRVLGGPVPSTGKLLVLEARSAGGPWIKFNVIRSDRRGGYRASYRFRFPGPASYQFRVLSEAEADYPFAGGGSNVVGVRER
jgi:hypothetical protein